MDSSSASEAVDYTVLTRTCSGSEEKRVPQQDLVRLCILSHPLVRNAVSALQNSPESGAGVRASCQASRARDRLRYTLQSRASELAHRLCKVLVKTNTGKETNIRVSSVTAERGSNNIYEHVFMTNRSAGNRRQACGSLERLPDFRIPEEEWVQKSKQPESSVEILGCAATPHNSTPKFKPIDWNSN